MWTHAEIMEDTTYLQYYYDFRGATMGWPTWTDIERDFIPDSSGKPGPRGFDAYNRGREGGILLSDPSDLRIPQVFGGGPGVTIWFTWLEFQWIVWGWQMGLVAQHNLPMEWNGPWHQEYPAGTGSTFTAWIGYSIGLRDDIRPFSDYTDPWMNTFGNDPQGNPISRPSFSLITTWTRSFGIGNYGNQLGFTSRNPIGQMYYLTGQQNNSTAQGQDIRLGIYGEGELVNFTNILEKTSPPGQPVTIARSIYINGALVYQREGRPGIEVAVTSQGFYLRAGTGSSDDIRYSHGVGYVSNMAYWNYVKPLPVPKGKESWGIIAA